MVKCNNKHRKGYTMKKLPIILSIIIIIFFTFDNRLKIVDYSLKSDKISGDVKLALVTDLHSCLYGENQANLINAIENYKPDAVLLGGDIFDDYYINNNSHIFIESIVKKYKMYYVSGNHEWWSGEMYHYFDYLKSVGVTVLRGDCDYLTVNGNNIVISGVDDPEAGDAVYDNQLETVAKNIDSENYNILLAHRPEKAEEYFAHDFDLVLSGHAHGGQFRIPVLLNGFFAPNQGLFPKLAGGMYDFGDSKLIVSRGLSKENTKLPRMFNRPELVFITLTR